MDLFPRPSPSTLEIYCSLNNYINIAPKTLYGKTNASNLDIRKLIDRMLPLAKRQMMLISKNFKGKTDKDTARNIYDFLKVRITYKEDGPNQVVKAPSALIRDSVGDCKSYAVFTSAILSNLKIPHSLVYTSYNNDPTPGHVYVQLKDGTIIDAVWHSFNSEKTPTYKYFKKII